MTCPRLAFALLHHHLLERTVQLHDLRLKTRVTVCLMRTSSISQMPPSHAFSTRDAGARQQCTYTLHHGSACAIGLRQGAAVHVRVRLLSLHQLRAPEGLARCSLLAGHGGSIAGVEGRVVFLDVLSAVKDVVVREESVDLALKRCFENSRSVSPRMELGSQIQAPRPRNGSARNRSDGATLATSDACESSPCTYSNT